MDSIPDVVRPRPQGRLSQLLALRQYLRTPRIVRFLMVFSVAWSLLWFVAKLYITDVARPDGMVVNNAGRLRYTLVQYQVEFIMEALGHALEDTPSAFAYHPALNASFYRERVLDA